MHPASLGTTAPYSTSYSTWSGNTVSSAVAVHPASLGKTAAYSTSYSTWSGNTVSFSVAVHPASLCKTAPYSTLHGQEIPYLFVLLYTLLA